MDIVADGTAAVKRAQQVVIHPLYVRLTHWINAVAVLIMIGSGWQIYNASPLFAFAFPDGVTLGGWLAGGLLWHFAAMWLLAANGLVYLMVGSLTGRFRRKLLPIRPSEIAGDLRAPCPAGFATTTPRSTTRCRRRSMSASSSPGSSSSYPASPCGSRFNSTC